MQDIQDKLRKMPDKPGVYIMKDENGNIIYVGKALNLKNRVRQYFQAASAQSPKVGAMVARINEFEYIVTDSEFEALILECNLIKENKPRYNVKLVDDKNYPYIKITMNEQFPRIFLTRSFIKDGARYFGPYSNAASARAGIDMIKKMFPVKTCKRKFPRDIGKERPCLNYHIFQCLGPCRGDINEKEYRALMKDICRFLDGKREEVARNLEKQMKTAADNMEFEKAALLRNKINIIKQISEKQKALSTEYGDMDAVGFAEGEASCCIQVFLIRGGKLIGRRHFIIERAVEGGSGELISSFVKQFYSSAAYIPEEIVLQENIDETDLIERWFSEKRGSKVHICIPRRGEKLHLVELASKNAAICLNLYEEKIKMDEGMTDNIAQLAKLLGLEKIPYRIEAFDVSNTGNNEITASMAVFENGLPAKGEYRRFRIKSSLEQNDYAAMQETIFRRFKHTHTVYTEAEKENGVSAGGDTIAAVEGDIVTAGFSKIPDLILVDGGTGHVNAVNNILQEIGMNIPVCGMVKDEKHRTKSLAQGYASMARVDLAGSVPVLRLITAIQNEAHRFALKYNKKLRSKRYRVSVLDKINGIGEIRKKALLSHFGSIERIKKAGRDELQAVEGMNRIAADRVFAYFHDHE